MGVDRIASTRESTKGVWTAELRAKQGYTIDKDIQQIIRVQSPPWPTHVLLHLATLTLQPCDVFSSVRSFNCYIVYQAK